MDHISNVSSHLQADKLQVPTTKKISGSEEGSSEKPASQNQLVDQAEFSELGKLLGEARDLPDIRAEKVAEMRAALELDEEKFINDRLEGTLDALVEDLFGR